MRRPLALFCLLFLCGATQARADYRFAVPKMLLEVTPNKDASATLEYTIMFECQPDAQPVDVVDVGLPHRNYSISNMTATLDGQPLSGIKKSTYVSVGVEVPLGEYAIQPGKRGEFRFKCTMPDMVFQDTTRPDYASLRITPTWFDAASLVGSTELGIAVYLPASVPPDKVVHQLEPFQVFKLKDRTGVGWTTGAWQASRPYMVGVSFPKDWMDRVVRMTKLGLAWKWWKEDSGARAAWGVFFFILFAIFFFRMTGGTGCSVFGMLLIGGIVLFAASPAAEAAALPVLIPIWVLAGRARKARRRKYLPPIVSVESGGIKRGLTVPEAAVLLELGLGKVLTLLVLGMLKKGLVEKVADDPFTVRIAEPYRGGRKTRAEAARANGAVIHAYEQPFLDAFEKSPDTPIPKLNLREEMKQLIEHTVARMKGFNVDETAEYYRSIISRAWKEAEAIGDLQQRTSFVDDQLLWLMADDHYDQRFNSWHSSGYRYSPGWIGGAAGPAAPSGPAPIVTGGRTALGDVAASFAGWSENVSGRLASTLDPVSVGTGPRGTIDLSGVDRVTGDILKSMASSSGSGRAGGGGCACACAGCACACACAGGGR